MIVRDSLYIDGAWVSPSGSDTLDVIDSTTEEVFATIPAGTVADIDRAVQAAKSSRLPLQAALPGLHQYVVALKAALVGYFGKGNPALAAFGISASKPKQLTAAQKTARAAKAAETRKQRGTLGKRQKEQVKFQGQIEVQANVAGTPVSGGNATSPASASSAGQSSPPSGSSGAGPTSGA